MSSSTIPSAFVISVCFTVAARCSQAGHEDPRLLTERLLALRTAWSDCDWNETSALAAVALTTAPKGSDAWFEAASMLADAHYRDGNDRAVQALYRESAAYVIERERGDVAAVTGLSQRFGPLPPATRACAAAIGLAAARIHQADGMHEPALLNLEGVLEMTQVASTEVGSANHRRALLDAARSWQALASDREARALLERLRDGFPGTREAALALALLQQIDGLGAYRGKYGGDGKHRERMEAVREALPRARERVAAALGQDPKLLESVPVGIADQPQVLEHADAFTDADPRRPFPPIVVLFSETLAVGAGDAEQLLVHELTHAALAREFGLQYESWPPWLTEGLPQGVAGQWERHADLVLEHWLMQDPERFGSARFWSDHPLHIDAKLCRRAPTTEEGLAPSVLAELAGDGGIKRFLDPVRRGLSLEDAFAKLHPAGLAAFPQHARAELERRLSMKREVALPWIERLVAARALGPAASLATAEDVLADVAPPLARGFALWERARSRDALGRTAEADRDYDELLAARRDHPAYLDLAQWGKVRCLLALGRRDAAARALEEILRGTTSPQLARLARDQLEALGQPRSRR